MKNLLLTALLALCVMPMMHAQAKKGYEKSIEIGSSIGVGKYKNNTYSVSMINGYRFNEYFFLGAGIGIGYSNVLSFINYDDIRLLGKEIDLTKKLRTESIPAPIFLSAKINIDKPLLSPFFRIDVGYTIDVRQYLRDAPGFMLEPSAGIDFMLSNSISLYSLVGFNLQHQKLVVVNSATSKNEDLKIDTKSLMLQAISLRLGVRF